VKNIQFFTMPIYWYCLKMFILYLNNHWSIDGRTLDILQPMWDLEQRHLHLQILTIVKIFSTMNLTSNVLFNSTLDSGSQNIFDGLFQPRASKVIFLFLSFIFTLASMFLSYAIIWYERFGTDQVKLFYVNVFW